MEHMSDFIALRGVKKVYGGEGQSEPVYALKGIDLDIHD